MSEFKHEIQICQVTPTLDTAAYAANDVLFASVQVPGKFYGGKIKYVVAIDKDDVGEASVLYFFRSNVSLGTFNAVPNISDANAAELLGTVTIAAGTDLGGVRVTSVVADIPFETPSGIIYVGGITTTALTHTASGMTYNIAIEKMA